MKIQYLRWWFLLVENILKLILGCLLLLLSHVFLPSLRCYSVKPAVVTVFGNGNIITTYRSNLQCSNSWGEWPHRNRGKRKQSFLPDILWISGLNVGPPGGRHGSVDSTSHGNWMVLREVRWCCNIVPVFSYGEIAQPSLNLGVSSFQEICFEKNVNFLD